MFNDSYFEEKDFKRNESQTGPEIRNIRNIRYQTGSENGSHC